MQEEFDKITAGQTGGQNDHSTCRISSINSSQNKNSTSDFCEIYLDFRTAPTQDMNELCTMLEKLKRGLGVQVEVDYMQFPSFLNENPLVKTQKSGLPYWSHAGLYAEHNFSAVVFGPGKIANAHTFNEYVAVKDVESARDILVTVKDRI